MLRIEFDTFCLSVKMLIKKYMIF